MSSIFMQSSTYLQFESTLIGFLIKISGGKAINTTEARLAIHTMVERGLYNRSRFEDPSYKDYESWAAEASAIYQYSRSKDADHMYTICGMLQDFYESKYKTAALSM